jgi:hypothetical protein
MSDGLSRRSGAAHLAWCRGSLSKNNVQTKACDPNRPAAHRGFYLAVVRSVALRSLASRQMYDETCHSANDPADEDRRAKRPSGGRFRVGGGAQCAELPQ